MRGGTLAFDFTVIFFLDINNMAQDNESTEWQGDTQPDPPTSDIEEEQNHGELNQTDETELGGNDMIIGTLDNRDQDDPSQAEGKYTFPATPGGDIPGTS